MSELTNTSCQSDSDIVFYGPYQIVYGINAIFSITAIFTCVYFMKTCIWASTFHRHFKLLITMYFFSHFLQATGFFLSYALIIQRIINYSTNCDIYQIPYLYSIIHILIAASLLCGNCIQVFMSFERFLATIHVKQYESSSSMQQIVFYIFGGIIFPVIVLFWVYKVGDFHYPVISALSPPKGVEQRLNILFFASFVVIFLSMISLQILRNINKRQEINVCYSLSGRYQIMENIYTTKFITSILIINMIVTMVYIIGVYVLRNVNFEIFANNLPLLATMKLCFYLHPSFTCFLPIFSSWHCSKMRKNRAEKNERILQLKTKGREGSDVYNQLLFNQWSQHFGKSV